MQTKAAQTYTCEEAAAILDIPKETFRRWCRRGRIRAHYDRGMVQKGYVVMKTDLHAFLEAIQEPWRIPVEEKVG